jgi:hypothetical protein
LPRPASLRRVPSSTSGGILNATVRSAGTRPWPEHCWQGRSTTVPYPPQRGQRYSPGLLESWPLPSQVVQGRAWAPEASPDPPQAPHATSLAYFSSLVAPDTRSVALMVQSACRSLAPGGGCRACARSRPPAGRLVRPPPEPAVDDGGQDPTGRASNVQAGSRPSGWRALSLSMSSITDSL